VQKAVIKRQGAIHHGAGFEHSIGDAWTDVRKRSC
jgi:hypothetical protein